ncbi:Hypothetical protein, predicted transmembrane protein [Metamycoplasma auris 15026]|uniref:Uncharacterized protein n=1 Tax=Metamycoplasma auris 15026 TaxID=1188233 RepID=N9UZW8_9BACT|nr:hypothetical protein [Metamycoplasma auris]ENY68692.1 Hypothetical protein, predicted transmembrane protein [Metamycoplasma auris 15026]
MFIAHNQIQRQLEESNNVWTEEFIINAEQSSYLNNWSSLNELTKLRIRRIIQNDKFILAFEHHNNLEEVKEIKIEATINNQKIEMTPIYIDFKKQFLLKYNSDLDTKSKLEFKDITNINFEIYYKIGWEWYQTKRYTYWIKRNEKSKNILIKNKTDIQILSEIEVASNPDRMHKEQINHKFKTKYLNFGLKPNPLRVAYYNTKLYDLHISKIGKEDNLQYTLNESDTYNLSFSDAQIFNPYKEKYETKLNYKSFNNLEINIDSYSYYDKQTESIIVGQQNPDAKNGLLIPLKHSGIFGYQINLDLGKNLKDFKLNYSQEFPKAFFNLDDGLIKMSTKIVKGWLTDEKWHKIKYENFDKVIKHADSLDFIENIERK